MPGSKGKPTVIAFALCLVVTALPAHAVEEPVTYFDLGVDANTLPQDAAGAKAYLAKQALETQHVLRAACDNFVKHPADAEMPQTVKFCQFILGD
jgi:hypothetical protein